MQVFTTIRQYRSHRFVRSITALQLGTVGATVVQSVAGILLARVMGPHEYGRFAVMMSLASIASAILGVGVMDAMAPSLVRTLNDDQVLERRRILYFLGRFVFLASCVAIIASLLLPFVASVLYHDAAIGWSAYVVVCAAALSSLALAPSQLILQVRSSIRTLSLVTFSDQFIRQIAVVLLAYLGFGVMGAAIGHFVGASALFILCSFAWRFHHGSWSSLPTLHEAWFRGSVRDQELFQSTLWVLADRNLAMLFAGSPIAIAALYLSAVDISYFKIAFAWVLLALSVLSPVTTLLNTELANISQQGVRSLRKAFMKVSGYAVVFSLGLSFSAAILARPLFRLLYGAQYTDAAGIVWWLIPFGCLYGLGIALGPMWRSMQLVKLSLRINILVLCIGVPLAMIGLERWGIGGAVAMVTSWYGASHVLSFWYLFRRLGKMQAL